MVSCIFSEQHTNDSVNVAFSISLQAYKLKFIKFACYFVSNIKSGEKVVAALQNYS